MNATECPVCCKTFSKTYIQSHVNTCLGTAAEELPAKRHKPSHTNNVLTMEPAPETASQPVSKCLLQASDSVLKSARQVKSIIDQMNDVFGSKPLADIARPSCMTDYIGQHHVLQEGKMLHKVAKHTALPSLIFHGPPGCGKTTLINILATKSKEAGSGQRFVKMSATNSGKADVQSVIKIAKNEQKMFKRRTLLFIDEIHRFNKLQQDTFLPHVEDGTIALLGATTENPSFALNSALLSRCHVVELQKLTSKDIEDLLLKVIAKHLKFCCIVDDGDNVVVPNGNTTAKAAAEETLHVHLSALRALGNMCDGDARVALNALQSAVQHAAADQSTGKHALTLDHVNASLQRTHILYDKMGDQHYHMLSALQKSVRGSNHNASLYWLTRMLMGGEDPKVIARRLIIMASEDIGLADPNALKIAVAAFQSCMFVGMPECELCLAQCVTYLARAPKSREICNALQRTKAEIRKHKGPMPSVPLHLRSCYNYDKSDDATKQMYLPDGMHDISFFDP